MFLKILTISLVALLLTACGKEISPNLNSGDNSKAPREFLRRSTAGRTA